MIYYSVLANTLTLENIACGRVCSYAPFTVIPRIPQRVEVWKEVHMFLVVYISIKEVIL